MQPFLKLLLRLICAGASIAVGLYLLMISTMGPSFTEIEIGQKKLDYLIRLAIAITGLLIIIIALVWIISSVLKIITTWLQK